MGEMPIYEEVVTCLLAWIAPYFPAFWGCAVGWEAVQRVDVSLRPVAHFGCFRDRGDHAGTRVWLEKLECA